MNNNILSFELYRHTQTDKAVCVSKQPKSEKIWLPFQMITITEEPIPKKMGNKLRINVFDTVFIEMPEWLAEEKNLI